MIKKQVLLENDLDHQETTRVHDLSQLISGQEMGNQDLQPTRDRFVVQERDIIQPEKHLRDNGSALRKTGTVFWSNYLLYDILY